SSLGITDPTNGVTTSITAGDSGYNTGQSSSSDNLSDTTFAPNSGMSEKLKDVAKSYRDDVIGDRGPLNINIAGSPSAGVTMNVGANLILSDSSRENVNGNDTSNALGSDAGDVKFLDANGDSVGGKIHSGSTKIVNTDDGHGDTVVSTNIV